MRFAGVSGDFNPLHFDPETAHAAGFDDVVVVGALSASLVIGELGRTHDVSTLRRYSVRFLAPVLIDSTLDVEYGDSPAADATAVDVAAAVSVNGHAVMEANARFSENAIALDALPDDFVALDEPYRWVVEEGAAREFAVATGQTPHGGRGSMVSPTFAATAMRWSGSDRDFVQRLDFDFARILHGGSTFEYGPLPLRVGEELWVTEGHSGRTTVEGRSGTLRMADAHLVITDEQGTVRTRVTHRIVERAQK